MSGQSSEKRILDAACALIESRGYNGFSFKDVSRQVGIQPASIHYHFPAKADLGLAVVSQNRRLLGAFMARIDGQFSSPRRRLDAFLKHFGDKSGERHLNLIWGVLSAEFNTLPEVMRGATPPLHRCRSLACPPD